MKKHNKVRISLDLTLEMHAALEKLAASSGESKSDILKKGIRLMELAIRAKQQGKKFGIAENSDSLSLEIVGL